MSTSHALTPRAGRAGGKLREVDALYGSQSDQMARLLAKYSAEEFAVVMDFLEQTSTALDAEIQALKESAKKALSQES